MLGCHQIQKAGLLGWLTGLAVLAMPAHADTVTNGITAVNPPGATQGVSGLVVTFTMATNRTPPLPPTAVAPTSVSIGAISGTSISRPNVSNVIATFTIPGGEPPGLKTCEIWFAPPPMPTGLPSTCYNKIDGFNVDPAANQPVVTITNVKTFVSNLITSITIGGTNDTNVVGTMTWTNTLAGTSGTFAASTVWSFSAPLVPGENRITVSGTNSTGSAGSDSVIIVRLPGDPTLDYVVVDTGQFNCYDATGNVISAPSPGQPFYGQDAQLDGPQPNYIDMEDGTVWDVNTGLMWQKSPDLQNRVAWTTAVAAASATNIAGYTDWRMPTIKELYSLIQFYGLTGTTSNNSIPYLDTNYFDHVYGETNLGYRIIDVQFWSGTKYVGQTQLASSPADTVFGVNFADGRIKGYPELDPNPTGGTYKLFVRYVRGNPNYGVNDFEDNGDGTVSDNNTGLMWSQDDLGGTQKWEQALAFVEDLNATNFLGYNDWRLPNVKELHSLLDYTKAPAATNAAALGPAINTNFFHLTTNESWFISGTTHAEGAVPPYGNYASYVCVGRAWGYVENPPGSGITNYWDVHGAGAQRSDPKDGDPADYAGGLGPQGDEIRIFNWVRVVRDFEPVATPPSITITNGSVTITNLQTYTLSGLSSNLDGHITLTNVTKGDTFQIAATSAWQNVVDEMAEGTNVITVSGTNSAGSVIVTTTVNVVITPVIYVAEVIEPPSQNGASWATAFEDLQDALALATTQQIWVAAGVYYPDEAAAGRSGVANDDPYSTFLLGGAVQLYGGFVGTETNVNQRDPASNVTVLSGDIDQNDATNVLGVVTNEPDSNLNGSNAYHVVSASGTGPFLLDGFTITAGKAFGPGADLNGAGLFLNGATGVVRQCIFSGNYADYNAAAAYINNHSVLQVSDTTVQGNQGGRGGTLSLLDNSSASLTNCLFQDNAANAGGGVAYQQTGSSLLFTRCAILGNSAQSGGFFFQDGGYARFETVLASGNLAFDTGAGIYNNAGEVVLVNVTLSGNAADTDRGVLYTKAGGTSTVKNCIFWNNAVAGSTVRSDASITNDGTVAVSVNNSIVQNSGGSTNWNAVMGTDNGGNLDMDPLFAGAVSPSNAPSMAGDYRPFSISPAIDTGDNAPVTITNDLDGAARIVGTVNMGAYELASATTFYVAPGGSHTAPYTSWATAATNIQTAIDEATSGDIVLVSNGVYNTGGRVAGSSLLTNRVVIDKPITVRSVNGASATVIVGNKTLGNAAVRGVWMTNGATLAGFTITNGGTRTSGGVVDEQSAAGIIGQSTACIVSNCVVAGNVANYSSGGGGHCTFHNCLIAGNTAGAGGGGSAEATLVNCTVVSNTTPVFGLGGGVLDCAVTNSIVYFNTAFSGDNYAANTSTLSFAYSCTTPSAPGTGNITNDPLFVSRATGNFRLQLSSPALDLGNNADAPGDTDLDGITRIINGTVDMGAYEVVPILISITNLGETVSNISVIAIGGTSTNLVGQMRWTNSLTGASATFAASNDWLASGIALLPGANLITVSGTNAAGFAASDNVTITADSVLEDGGATPIHYVAPGGNNTWPYTNWVMAATTIQAAADAAMEGDTVLVSNGVYNTGGRAYTGHVLTNRVLLTRQVTLRSVNGPDVTVIEGSGPIGPAAVRGLFVWSNATVSGFTITNGFTATSGGFDRAGAGILLYNGSNVISNCTVVANVANDYGGGIYAHSVSHLDVLDCTIAENSCVAYGGGLVSYAAGSIRNTTFSHNSAGGGGGGADLEGGQIVSNCVFVGNVASNFEGGGIYLTGGGVIENCSIISNVCGDYGGGVCFEGTMPTMRWCTVTGNEAKNYGGGLEFIDDAVVIGCLIAGNTAPYAGGVNVESGGSLSKFINCTMAGNVATSSGGGIQVGFDSIVHLTNTIVYGNTAVTGSDYATNNGGLVDFAYSCTYPDPGGTGNITNDPQFVDAAGGNYRLSITSSCINAGTNLDELAGTLDLDGNTRVYESVIDMGAYEAYDDGSDADSDGASDWQELRTYGTDINDPDTDGDHVNDGDEVIAGTQGTNANSFLYLGISSIGTNTVNMYWPSANGRGYYLDATTNLVTGPWVNLTQEDGTAPTNTLIAPSTNSAIHYRLRVQIGTFD